MVLTWGQSSGENQLTGSAIVTERSVVKNRAGATRPDVRRRNAFASF